MKKNKLISMIFAVVFVGILIFGFTRLDSFNLNRVGTDKYYTLIAGNGEKYEDGSSNGEVFYRYRYTLSCYDKDGKEKTLEFTSGNELKQGAYLELFYKDSKGVTSYKEVSKSDLPKKVVGLL